MYRRNACSATARAAAIPEDEIDERRKARTSWRAPIPRLAKHDLGGASSVLVAWAHMGWKMD